MDLQVLLKKPLDNREEVWDIIRQFAAHWASPLSEEDGWNNDEIEEAQQRLQLRIPAAMREAYSLFGRRVDLTKNQDVLRSPKQLTIDINHEALVFRDENQGAACWGILFSDVSSGEPDPPVYIKYDVGDKSVERWELWEGRFSLATLSMVMWEAMHDPEAHTDYAHWSDGMEDDLARITHDYPELVSIPLSYFQGARWFASSDVLILANDFGVHVRARVEEELALVRDRLPVLSDNWLGGL